MEKIKLLLVDDHEIFLEGLQRLLSDVGNIDVIGTANDGNEALAFLQEHEPDLILTDLSMPGMDGIALVKEVKKNYPAIKIMVLTVHNDRPTVSEILMAEAEGYLLKNSSKKELIAAINNVGGGATYYSNEVMNIILNKFQFQARQREAASNLTARELEILRLIADEKSSEEIAEELFISKRTVDTHRTNLLKKTEKDTVVGLLKYAVEYGLIAL